jgi:catechol 2,3-dioxygenase-like lactoylglutathione lyase family enzyme
MINGIVGITLWTADLDRLFRFYRDTLRLPLHSFHEDEGFAAFQLGDLRFNVGRHSQISGRSRDPLRVMPHLGVDDIHAEYERLAAAGVEFIRVPEQEHWGGWVATLRDPDGNVLQLLQLPQ